MDFLVMPASGSCNLVSLDKEPKAQITITAPVGQGPKARNFKEDVRTIQKALNRVAAKGELGGPVSPLSEDGIFGPKTNAAIRRFQETRLKIFDGVIELGKKTINTLNEILGSSGQASGGVRSPQTRPGTRSSLVGDSSVDLKAKVRESLPLVTLSIAAALRNLQAVISGNPAGSTTTADATDRLERHFKVSTLTAPLQTQARLNLFRTFLSYSAILVDTTVLGIDALDEFDVDPANPRKALTASRGFFLSGLKNKTGLPADKIHLGLGFFAPEITPEFGAYIILHEMAHFIGQPDGAEIGTDRGRGWFDDIFIKPLTAQDRLANADSYATFALECRRENPAKPPFIQGAPGGNAGAR